MVSRAESLRRYGWMIALNRRRPPFLPSSPTSRSGLMVILGRRRVSIPLYSNKLLIATEELVQPPASLSSQNQLSYHPETAVHYELLTSEINIISTLA